MKRLILLFATFMALWACKPQDLIYKDMYEAANKVDYPQKASNLVAEAGYLSVQLSWDAPVSPTCTEAIVYWNSHEDSLKVNLTDPKYNDGQRINVSFPGLEEDDYVFEVYIMNKAGYRSVKSEVMVTPLGPSYVVKLGCRNIKKASMSEINTVAFVEFAENVNLSVFSEFRYNNSAGGQTTVRVEPSEKGFTIQDLNRLNPGEYEYRSAFIIPQTPETLYSEWYSGNWLADEDYSNTVPEGVECLTFRADKFVKVTRDTENPYQFTFESVNATSAPRIFTNAMANPVQGTVLVFQYKQVQATSKFRIYWIDEGGSAVSGRHDNYDTSGYYYGVDEWNVAIIDMTEKFTVRSWEGKVGDYARIDITTPYGNVITVRNAHFRPKREEE